MNYSRSCSKLEIVLARNLPNHAWAGPDRVRGNALHKVAASTLVMVIHVLNVWKWATGSVFPLYKGMVGILKFHGGKVAEMLTGNGDWVSDRTSRTRSIMLRSTSSRSICSCICVKRSSSGIARTKGQFSTCCSCYACRALSRARRSALPLKRVECSNSYL